MLLKGKIALVTGGSRGIGREISLKLAEAGADVIINYFRRRDAAEETAEAVRAFGVRAHIIKANIADPKKIDLMFEEIEKKFGRLDIMVNNAASGVARAAIDLDVHGWDWTMNINARAALLCAQRSRTLMTDGGSIVNISSLGSHMVLPIYTAVGVSKAALEALTRYLAIDFAQYNIRVNAISAAAVETEALKLYKQDPKLHRQMIVNTPVGRMVQSADVANAAVFLCSDASTMIRGQVIIVDGGLSIVGFMPEPVGEEPACD